MCLLKGPGGPIPRRPEKFRTLEDDSNASTEPKPLCSTWLLKAPRIIIRCVCRCVVFAMLFFSWSKYIYTVHWYVSKCNVRCIPFCPLCLHWVWDRAGQIFWIYFALSALCECVTGHKHAGMFLLDGFQEASGELSEVSPFMLHLVNVCEGVSITKRLLDHKLSWSFQHSHSLSSSLD